MTSAPNTPGSPWNRASGKVPMSIRSSGRLCQPNPGPHCPAPAPWGGLEGGGLGYILDPTDGRRRVTLSLRLAEDLLPADIDRVSPAAGLSPILVRGRVLPGRPRAAKQGFDRHPLAGWSCVEPENSIPASVIGTAASR